MESGKQYQGKFSISLCSGLHAHGTQKERHRIILCDVDFVVIATWGYYREDRTVTDMAHLSVDYQLLYIPCGTGTVIL
jgi:hypothetical protein